jgi:tetratricopeptide (TPR) repeat protein
MGYLTQLFMDEKYEFLATEAQSMVQDPAYKFFDFEAEFNKAGYQMLGSGQFEGALYVFEMNTKLFPDSPNTWDSLAEGYWKSGDLIKAKEYYNKAIQLDPEGATANNSKAMLKKMEAEQ